MHLEDNVRLLVVSDADLPLAYAAAELSIVPSVALEGFGLITLESLAAGTPVLVTPVGGLPEAVAPLAPQLVLEGVGEKALAQGMTDVLRGKVSIPTPFECRDFIQQRHLWPLIAKQVGAIYREAEQGG